MPSRAPSSSRLRRAEKFGNKRRRLDDRPDAGPRGARSRGTAAPSMVALPPVGRTSPRMQRIVVVFPEPFGPRKPNTPPSGTSRSSPAMATVAPCRYCLRRPSSWITDISLGPSGVRTSCPLPPALGARDATRAVPSHHALPVRRARGGRRPGGVGGRDHRGIRGLDVLLVDKATFPRDKTCGDGLTTGALRLLEQLGFPLDTIPSYTSVRECVIVTPNRRHVTLPLRGNGEYAGVVPGRSSIPHGRARGPTRRRRARRQRDHEPRSARRGTGRGRSARPRGSSPSWPTALRSRPAR